MAKLYFKYGAMGSSKTAQALITKYNYEENGMRVWLIKPAADSRDGEIILRSRVGLEAPAEVISETADICQLFEKRGKIDVIIADECQFLMPEQIDQLRELIASTDKKANYDSAIFDIVNEQAAAFFQGQKSAEEVAKLIQSKANIFVNEQR